jgi:MYXO-CTERM domain-containing protein
VRRALVTLLCLLAGAAALAAVPAAGAAPLSDCTSSSGTVIAVNYGHWKGPVVVGCGVGQPTGYRLLHAAGFSTAGDLHDGPAFICRLGDTAFHRGAQYPTSSEEDCVDTPPASAYWSYWLAPAGRNTWSYSQLGAMAEKPKPGEVELWTFGGTNIAGTRGSGVPAFSPDELRTFVDAHDGGRDGAPKGPPTSGPRIISAEATSVSASSGSALPTIIGVCVAALLAGAAALAVRRRRREE